MLRSVLKTTVGLALGFGVGMVSAQTLRNADEPAEFPPSSFTGKQYVDSKGCVFVRAGFDGAVTWVPRVSRSRKVLCGLQPTFAARPKPAPAPAPETRVVAAPPPKPTPAPVASPKPTPPRVAVAVKPAPPVAKPAPVQTPPRRVVVAPPKPVRTTTVKPAPTTLTRIPVKPVPGVRTACPGASALSQQYLNSSTHAVRCGPQGANPTAVATRGGPNGGSAPAIQVPAPPKIAPPEGYKAAFEDDRFNPNRGKGTYEGHVQMRLVWTSGVPRRLIDQNTGRDVTSLFKGLRFPFISLKQQKRYVAVNGWPRESGVTVSTKNTPPTATPKPAPAGNGHRYVQVGTFGVPANAQRAAARLQALGLPVRVGTYKKKGKTYRIVLAGPFAGAAQLNAGLSAARRGGFGDAFTRK